MTFNQKIRLGRTGLVVGRLGISSSFGAPAQAFEEAFERGCNYFTWGTVIKGRSQAMKDAIINISRRGQREELVLVNLSYAHSAFLTERYLQKGLKKLGSDYFDVLLLGYFSRPPARRIIDGALRLKEKGLVRFIGITSHNRNLFLRLGEENLFDIFHVRYNAAHRGAEQDIFPGLSQNALSQGIVSFTGTCWGRLLDAKKMPPGHSPATAPDCYRFALSQQAIHVCMTGARNLDQMRENLSVLDSVPMSDEEIRRMHLIGDFVYRKKKRSHS